MSPSQVVTCVPFGPELKTSCVRVALVEVKPAPNTASGAFVGRDDKGLASRVSHS